MQLVRCILLVSILLLFLSCNQNKENVGIYETVINTTIVPLPPPPKIYDVDSVINKEVVDSLKSVKMDIGVNPKKIEFNGNFKELFKNFKFNDFSYFESNNKISLKALKARESLHFTILEKPITSFLKKEKQFDGILSLSEIIYNNKKDKSLVIIGYNNIIILYLLNKEDNKWEIEDQRTLLIS